MISYKNLARLASVLFTIIVVSTPVAAQDLTEVPIEEPRRSERGAVGISYGLLFGITSGEFPSLIFPNDGETRAATPDDLATTSSGGAEVLINGYMPVGERIGILIEMGVRRSVAEFAAADSVGTLELQQQRFTLGLGARYAIIDPVAGDPPVGLGFDALLRIGFAPEANRVEVGATDSSGALVGSFENNDPFATAIEFHLGPIVSFHATPDLDLFVRGTYPIGLTCLFKEAVVPDSDFSIASIAAAAGLAYRF